MHSGIRRRRYDQLGYEQKWGGSKAEPGAGKEGGGGEGWLSDQARTMPAALKR